MSAVKSLGEWNDNSDLIVDVARCGYLDTDWPTLDCTYGLGVWWKKFRPTTFIGCDANVSLSPVGFAVDFRRMPFAAGAFKCVAYDPPYKLNGTPSEADIRYGVHIPTRWQDRMQLCEDGATECVRLLPVGGFLLFKCQDQVCSGQVRWQTREFADHVESFAGMRLIDNFILPGGREQPKDRSQVHSRHNYSTLMIFTKEKAKRARTHPRP